MPTFKRQDLPKLLAQIAADEIAPAYLLVGERFLCREAAAAIEAALLPDERQRQNQLTIIDGDKEEPGKTLARLRTYSLFTGRQVTKVVDSRLLYSKTVAKTLWEKAQEARGSENRRETERHLKAMLGLAGLAPVAWHRDHLAEISASQWQKLFGFAKPADTAWAGEFLSTDDDRPPAAAKGDAGEELMSALEAGLPPGKVLLLLAETADKRKKLYKYLEKKAVIVDLGIDSGSSAPARKEQAALLKNLIHETLAGFNKKIRPDALELLLERVGFHPVAVVMEAEKLALYLDEQETIGRREVAELVGRTREEAIFELSEAFTGGRLEKSISILERLQQGGMHPLAILGGLRNHVRKLLLARAVQDQAGRPCDSSLAYPAFQKNYLPQVKKAWEEQADQTTPAEAFTWPGSFPTHPYALYQLFLQAGRLSSRQLQELLRALLVAEHRLKGSGLPEDAVLSALLFAARQPATGAEPRPDQT
ncbi:DNA polymerase III subunit delta [Desulfurivibrio alkaliphilus]|uniref:DNA-directed DNA polymerase n=1 Tax=Desulfurivibrio alkaliphilus (strain DSM 19089 / UNIQEM U267 / AHT2) TaxID=589865 RepID=D6Z0D1_DESAT|nr:hypothetical protein [Desulfurivibrio alkaliphilus]ADH87164.1 DNA polymerase III delta [Desulfurivibrio alkaliphilus AHT 2]